MSFTINSLSEAIMLVLLASTVVLWMKAIYCFIHAIYFMLDDGMSFRKAWKAATRLM